MVNNLPLLTLSIILALAALASCAGGEQIASTEPSQTTPATPQAEPKDEMLHSAIRLIPGFSEERVGPDSNQDDLIVTLFSFDRPDLGLSPREFYSAVSILEYLVPELGMEDPRQLMPSGISSPDTFGE